MVQYSTDYQMDEEPDLKTSRFNSAVEQIQRFGMMWKEAYTHFKLSNYKKWNDVLDTFWREFSADLKEDDKKIIVYKGIEKELEALSPLHTPNMFGFKKIPNSYLKKVIEQKKVLTKKEIFLRRLQNELGKGTSYRDEFEDEFE